MLPMANEIRNAAIEESLTLSRAILGITISAMGGMGDITLSEYRIMVILRSRGPQRPSYLAANTGLSAATAGRCCVKLAHKGLVVRYRDPDDGRGVLVKLTVEGFHWIEDVLERRRALFTKIVEKLDEETQDMLARSFKAFVEAAGEPEEAEWPLYPPVLPA